MSESVKQERLVGCTDRDVLDRATAQGRVVITHDVAFGKAAISAGEPFVGIVYLRPGHISADFVLTLVDALIRSPIDVRPPFVVVAERRHSTVRVPGAHRASLVSALFLRDGVSARERRPLARLSGLQNTGRLPRTTMRPALLDRLAHRIRGVLLSHDVRFQSRGVAFVVRRNRPGVSTF